MKTMGFTVIKNELLNSSQLSIPARYLMCVLLKHAGQNDACYPGQTKLALELGVSDRYVRTLLNELEKANLISRRRSGFNKSNTYTLVKTYRNYSSGQLGNIVPLHQGSPVPTKSTYRKAKGKRGMEKVREVLTRQGILPSRPTPQLGPLTHEEGDEKT